MDCAKLLAKIEELVGRDKVGNHGTKGLRQRFRDLRNDDLVHREEILRQQRSLRSFLMEFQRKGCSGDVPSDAIELTGRPLPPLPLPFAPDPRVDRSDVVLRILALASRVRVAFYLQMERALARRGDVRHRC